MSDYSCACMISGTALEVYHCAVSESGVYYVEVLWEFPSVVGSQDKSWDKFVEKRKINSKSPGRDAAVRSSWRATLEPTGQDRSAYRRKMRSRSSISLLDSILGRIGWNIDARWEPDARAPHHQRPPARTGARLHSPPRVPGFRLLHTARSPQTALYHSATLAGLTLHSKT